MAAAVAASNLENDISTLAQTKNFCCDLSSLLFQATIIKLKENFLWLLLF
jgi:hypothetical protein